MNFYFKVNLRIIGKVRTVWIVMKAESIAHALAIADLRCFDSGFEVIGNSAIAISQQEYQQTINRLS
jgi:uncharacterized membrane protein